MCEAPTSSPHLADGWAQHASAPLDKVRRDIGSSGGSRGLTGERERHDHDAATCTACCATPPAIFCIENNEKKDDVQRHGEWRTMPQGLAVLVVESVA
jgi:hypothetical protein